MFVSIVALHVENGDALNREFMTQWFETDYYLNSKFGPIGAGAPFLQ